MSQENVEVVRRGYAESYGARSVDRSLGFIRDSMSEDFRFHNRPEWPGKSVYRLDEMPEIWAELDETYSDFSLAPEDYEDLGDFVLVKMAVSARLRESDTRLDETSYHLWEFRDGKVVEGWAFGDRQEALATVAT